MERHKKFDINEPIHSPLPYTFEIRVSKTYEPFTVSKLGGNCKMCIISDIGHSLNRNQEGTIARLNELSLVLRRLVFQVNVDKYDYIEMLQKHFKLVGIEYLPIGYGSNQNITFNATFLIDNGFNSNDITYDSVLKTINSSKFKERVEFYKKQTKLG